MPAKSFDMRRIARDMHRWLGLSSGLVVFVLGITGCIYAFMDELKALCYRDRLFVAGTAGERLPLSVLFAQAQRELGPDKAVTRIEFANDPLRTYVFRSIRTDNDAFMHWNYYRHFDRVYVDPYSGRTAFVENTKREFFQLVYGLHTNLLLGRAVGRPIVGCATLIFLISLITGIVLWWPNKWRKKLVAKRLRIEWGASAKRVNYDLHNTLGFYAATLCIVIALSGLVWSFGWMERSVQYLAGGAKATESTTEADTPWENDAGIALDAIAAGLRSTAPDAISYMINLPQSRRGPISASAYLHGATRFRRIQFKFDASDGAALSTRTFASLSAAEKISLMNYDIHVGGALGTGGRIAAFLASLICASLPITGCLIWYNRKWGKRKKGGLRER